jgi:hypothetical protein
VTLAAVVLVLTLVLGLVDVPPRRAAHPAAAVLAAPSPDRAFARVV